MAKYDYGGGCGCGLYAECEINCEHNPLNPFNVALTNYSKILEDATNSNDLSYMISVYNDYVDFTKQHENKNRYFLDKAFIKLQNKIIKLGVPNA
jgi:transcription elongation factor Elf1